jgi:kynureninase
VVKDPRAPTKPEDFQKQLDLALKIRDRVTEANQSVIAIRAAKEQLKPYLENANEKVKTQAKELTDELTKIEETVYQTKLKADEDALNYPIRLNNKLASVEGVVEETDVAPTAQSYQVFEELSAQLQTQLDQLHKVETSGIADFNKLVHDQNIPAIALKQKSAEN